MLGGLASLYDSSEYIFEFRRPLRDALIVIAEKCGKVYQV